VHFVLFVFAIFRGTLFCGSGFDMIRPERKLCSDLRKWFAGFGGETCPEGFFSSTFKAH
jgi:hypothetical protein